MSARIELSQLSPRYDLVIIGGGITGAGVLREAVRTGAKVLLVEQGDFASGTSSWSSKLVHGGLRYLKTGQWSLTLESVRERGRLMREAPGLVEAQPFVLPLYRGRKPGRWIMQIGLFIYDLMAGSLRSRFVSAPDLLAQEPHVAREGLIGAVAYEDARTDDARLVLRLILDSVALGATALNYVQARSTGPGQLQLTDRESGATRSLEAAMVVHATGAWAGEAPGAPTLRPLRGSHFVFPTHKLPVKSAVSWLHPKDARPVFAYPWQGAVVYGTTDLDHGDALAHPRMTADEAAYLLDGLLHQFPALKLTAADAVATYSGVRPVVASGKDDPSAESRESAMWSAPGVVSITGGKLTTFRVTAREVLREAAQQQPQLAPREDGPLFAPVAAESGERIAQTPFTWEGLRKAAQNEYVVHLEDLLMRRTRIGLVMERGGAALLPRIKAECQPLLGWDEARWAQEEKNYLEYWDRQHAPKI